MSDDQLWLRFDSVFFRLLVFNSARDAMLGIDRGRRVAAESGNADGFQRRLEIYQAPLGVERPGRAPATPESPTHTLERELPAIWQMPGKPTVGWPGTKNKRDHEVPLSKPALEILALLGPESAGHVFPSIKRGKCIAIPSTQGIWANADIPRFRPHDLRATCATKLDQLEFMREHISLILNHSEGGVTVGYIRHKARGHKRNALDAWSIELTAILQGEGKTDHKAEILPLRASA